MPIVKCNLCSKEIKRKPIYLKTQSKFYCSKQCKKIDSISTNRPITLNIGDKFNSCILISKIKIQGRNFWTCKCDCGIEFTRREDYIFKCLAKNQIISCNCKSKTRLRGKMHHAYKGHGDLSAEHFSHIKTHAKNRNIEFNITIEEAWQKFIEQNKKCALSGIELSLSESRRINSAQTASLDRIDSNKGYTYDNIQWVHKYVNIFKNTCDNTEFIKWCHLIAKHNPL